MPKYLEIGPFKGRISDSWDTLDMVEESDIIGELGGNLPIKDNTYDVIYASHVLEHVPWQKTEMAFSECLRILRKNGWLEIWVPDFKKIVKAYLSWDNVEDGWKRKNPEGILMKWVNGRLFYGDRGEGSLHKSCFDEEYLTYHFNKAGFINVQKIMEPPRTVDHGWINLGIKGQKP